MELKKLEHPLTVCKVKAVDDLDLSKEFYFIGKTDEEVSLVCKTDEENFEKALNVLSDAGYTVI